MIAPDTGSSVVEQHVPRPRQPRPLLRREPLGPLAQHELERQVGERSARAAASVPSPGPDLADRERLRTPQRLPARPQITASARAKSGTSVGTVANAPPRPILGPRA